MCLDVDKIVLNSNFINQKFRTMNTFERIKIRLSIGLMLSLLYACTTISYGQDNETRTILESFVESYKTDPMAITANFGIQIGDDWWHVNANRKQEGYAVGTKHIFHNYGPHNVTLHEGKPEIPTWYFSLADKTVLENINNKIWTASTAAMKSYPNDIVAFNLKNMEGFESSLEDDAIMYQVMEHFWKKEKVEVTNFARDNSLPTHGIGAVSLYTMKDKRIAWFSIRKGEAGNDNPDLEKGQCPNLFILTKGKGKALFAAEEIDVQEGMSVFVGPYVKHVIYNPYDEPLEGILILFGDNIDFALGQSYLDYLENQYHCLESYEDLFEK